MWSPEGDPQPQIDKMPYYSFTSTNENNNKGLQLTNSQDRHNTLRFRSPLENSTTHL